MSNLTPSTPPPDIQAAINRWLVHPSSGNTNTTYLNAWRRIKIATWKVPTLTHDEATLVIKRLYSEYSDNTVKSTVEAMSSLWNKLAKEGLVPTNPWAGQKIRLPKDKTPERVLSPGERDALIAAADNHNARDGLYARFLYYTGLRVSESIIVLWQEVRPVEKNGQIDHFAITVQGKGGKTRTVNLPARVMLGWIDKDGGIHDGLVQVVGPDNIRPGDRVWPFERQWGYKVIRGAAERAGLGKNVSPHWLRHTGATDALDAGASLRVVQESLGHASPVTTAKYTHVRPEDRISNHLPEV